MQTARRTIVIVAATAVGAVGVIGGVLAMSGVIPKRARLQAPPGASRPEAAAAAPMPPPILAAPAPVVEQASPVVAADGPGRPTPVVAPTAAASAEIETLLGGITGEVDDQIESFLAQAGVVLAALEVPPAHDRLMIQERLRAIESCRNAGEALAKRLRGLADEAAGRLAAAGVAGTRATGVAGQFALDFEGTARAASCDGYLQFCESGAQEAAYLLGHFGGWSLNERGAVTSEDAAVQGDARGRRMRIDLLLMRKKVLEEALRGR